MGGSISLLSSRTISKEFVAECKNNMASKERYALCHVVYGLRFESFLINRSHSNVEQDGNTSMY